MMQSAVPPHPQIVDLSQQTPPGALICQARYSSYFQRNSGTMVAKTPEKKTRGHERCVSVPLGIPEFDKIHRLEPDPLYYLLSNGRLHCTGKAQCLAYNIGTMSERTEISSLLIREAFYYTDAVSTQHLLFGHSREFDTSHSKESSNARSKSNPFSDLAYT